MRLPDGKGMAVGGHEGRHAIEISRAENFQERSVDLARSPQEQFAGCISCDCLFNREASPHPKSRLLEMFQGKDFGRCFES